MLCDGWEIKQGLRLKECRNAKGYSRTQLGNKLGASMETIKKYETGERKGLNNPETLTQLAEYLNVEKGYLSGDDNFVCESYTEYLEYKQLETAHLKKYMQILFPTLLISATTNNDLIEYSATLKEDLKMRKEFSAEDMDAFYNVVFEKLKAIIRDTFFDYQDDNYSTLEEFERYIKWHPDKLSDAAIKGIKDSYTRNIYPLPLKEVRDKVNKDHESKEGDTT